MSVKTALIPWLPWIAVGATAALVGGGVGVSGLLGHETTTVVEIGALGESSTVDALACPGGPTVTTIDRGARVLAIARSEDSSWVSVRDPRSAATTVWVPIGAVVVDDGQGATADLPVGEPCPEISLPPLDVVEAPPAPVAPAGPAAPPPAAAPAADTTAPSASGSASPTTINQSGYGTDRTTISVSGSDNVGVVKIVASWSATAGIAAGSVTVNAASGSFTFGPYAFPSSRSVPISVVAYDAAGNASAPFVITVTCTYVLI